MTTLNLQPTRRPTHAFTGTWLLLRFMLRRDRIRLPIWILSLTLLMAYFSSAMGLVLDEESLNAFGAFAANPVMALLGGPGYGFDQITVERFLAGMYGGYLMIGTALMSMLSISRHTRAEEQSGRAELVQSNVVGQHAQLTAALLLTVSMNVLTTLLLTLALATSPVEPESLASTILFAASIGAAGLVFAGIGAVTAQLSPFSRTTSGISGAVLAFAYLLRGFGDMSSTQNGQLAWLSWLSPIGWSQQSAPFTLDRWWPLLLSLGATCMLVMFSYRLQAKRDLGAGILPDRLGASQGSTWLNSPLMLAFRLQRSSLIWWSLAMALGGLAFGAFVNLMAESVSELPPEILAVMGGAGGIVEGYLGFIAIYLAVAGAVFTVLSVQSLITEERNRRIEAVLATPVSRTTWVLSWLTVTIVGALWLMVLGGAGTGIGAAITTGDTNLLGSTFVGHLAQTPALWVLAALGVAMYGLAPRLTALTWIFFAVSTIISFFGDMLELDDAVLKVSVFNHIGRYPADPIDWTAVAALVALSIGLTTVGVIGFRQRDVS